MLLCAYCTANVGNDCQGVRVALHLLVQPTVPREGQCLGFNHAHL
jgi:hypothetical protein